MDDIKLAMLGDKSAQERLTERGELLPCQFCKGKVFTVSGFGGLMFFKCKECGCVVSFDNHRCNQSKQEAIKQFNTRAPILTPEELEMLEEIE